MSTITPERRTERSDWVCENCSVECGTERKRCRDCGTSRF